MPAKASDSHSRRRAKDRKKKAKEAAAIKAEHEAHDVRGGGAPGDSRALEEKSIRAILRQCGRGIKAVEADGDCLFTAIAVENRRIPSPNLPVAVKASKLREMACDYIMVHKDRFAPFILDPSGVKGHVRFMREQGAWGGHLELQALAELSGKRIAVICVPASVLRGAVNPKEATAKPGDGLIWVNPAPMGEGSVEIPPSPADAEPDRVQAHSDPSVGVPPSAAATSSKSPLAPPAMQVTRLSSTSRTGSAETSPATSPAPPPPPPPGARSHEPYADGVEPAAPDSAGGGDASQPSSRTATTPTQDELAGRLPRFMPKLNDWVVARFAHAYALGEHYEATVPKGSGSSLSSFPGGGLFGLGSRQTSTFSGDSKPSSATKGSPVVGGAGARVFQPLPPGGPPPKQDSKKKGGGFNVRDFCC